MNLYLQDEPILLLGVFLTLGYLASLYFKQYRVFHIVIYLLTGFVVTNIILHESIVEDELDQWYFLIETQALGLIGFKIGTGLKFDLIKNHPRFIIIVLLAEAGGAFFTVFFVVIAFKGDLLIAFVLAGLATAAAPVATVEILRKKKTAGPLTKRIQWILAFDDVIAILIIESILVYLEAFYGGSVTVFHIFEGFKQEIGYAIILGVIVGYTLDEIIEKMDDELEMMELCFVILILVMGIAHYVNTSIISACTVVGIVTTNRLGDNYARMSDLMEVLMSPIIMLFFVLVGARIAFDDFSPFPWLAIVYLVARTGGKLFGAFGGTKYVGSERVLQNNLGLGLLPQGGVTIRLVALANDILVEAGESELGHMLITTLIISTIFSVILGSFGTTIAVNRSGEAGKSKIPQRLEHALDSRKN